MEHVRHIKKEAREIISRDVLNVLLGSILMFAVILLLEELQGRLTGMHEIYSQIEKAALANDYEAFQNIKPPTMPIFSQILGALLVFLTIIVEVGYEGYCLKRARGLMPRATEIIPPVRTFLRIYGLTFIQGILTAVGLMFFIAPGVFIHYTYRQSYYIMFDNPDLGIFECMRRSRQMMNGKRFQLFLHDFSFILWDILTIIFSPASIWVAPYKGIAHALFYVEISGTAPVIEIDPE